jgi:hypothetical protein
MIKTMTVTGIIIVIFSELSISASIPFAHKKPIMETKDIASNIIRSL